MSTWNWIKNENQLKIKLVRHSLWSSSVYRESKLVVCQSFERQSARFASWFKFQIGRQVSQIWVARHFVDYRSFRNIGRLVDWVGQIPLNNRNRIIDNAGVRIRFDWIAFEAHKFTEWFERQIAHCRTARQKYSETKL